jgi:hypothetical protein
MGESTPERPPRDARDWRRERKLACAVFALAALASLWLQNHRDGFGHLRHHDWVSAHNLALAANATPQSLWIGYTSCNAEPGGKRSYFYFNRFPALPSLLLKAVMAPFSRASAQIRAARHLTDLFFLATILVCARTLVRLGSRPLVAMGAALFAFSSPIHQIYRDMTSIDVYGLAGFAVAIHAIVRFQQGGGAARLLAAIFAALLLGLSAIGVLLCWWLLELGRLAARGARPGRRGRVRPARLGGFARRAAKLPATRAVLAGALGLALILAWNVAGEQRFLGRQVALGIAAPSGPADRASVLGSARFRLGLEGGDRWDLTAGWGSFLGRQALVLSLAATPWLWRDQPRSWPYRARPALVTAPLLLAAALWSIRGAGAARTGALILILAGAFWCLPMRRLTQYHNYQGIFYFGPTLVLAAHLLRRLPAGAARIGVGLCALVFLNATAVGNRHKGEEAPRVNAVTRDFERIAPLVGKGASLFAVGGRDEIAVRGFAPYAVDFYLPGRCFAPAEEGVDFVLSRSGIHGRWTNLTPANQHVFLFGAPRRPGAAGITPGMVGPETR